jgi:hypothetical protein
VIPKSHSASAWEAPVVENTIALYGNLAASPSETFFGLYFSPLHNNQAFGSQTDVRMMLHVQLLDVSNELRPHADFTLAMSTYQLVMEVDVTLVPLWSWLHLFPFCRSFYSAVSV